MKRINLSFNLVASFTQAICLCCPYMGPLTVSIGQRENGPPESTMTVRWNLKSWWPRDRIYQANQYWAEHPIHHSTHLISNIPFFSPKQGPKTDLRTSTTIQKKRKSSRVSPHMSTKGMLHNYIYGPSTNSNIPRHHDMKPLFLVHTMPAHTLAENTLNWSSATPLL